MHGSAVTLRGREAEIDAITALLDTARGGGSVASRGELEDIAAQLD